MFRRLSRRMMALGTVLALAITGFAVAYFTGGNSQASGGQDIGTAAPLTISGPTSTGKLVPGASQTLTFTVTNNNNTAVQYLGSHANFVLSMWAGDAWHPGGLTVSTAPNTPIPGCMASWFSAAEPTVPAQTLAPGAHIDVPVSVSMSESNSVQDACKATTALVNLSVS